MILGAFGVRHLGAGAWSSGSKSKFGDKAGFRR